MDTNHISLRARRLTGAGFAALLALGLAGCGDDDEGAEASTDDTAEVAAATTEAEGEPTGEPVVSDVWARSSAAGQTAGAAYMVVTGGAEDDRLVGASVPAEVAATVEVHETVAAGDDDAASAEGVMPEDAAAESGDDMGGADDDADDMGDMGDMGAMTMREVDGVDVPAGGTVELAPGGFHVMLLDLVAPLEAGDSFPIELTFASGATQSVTAEVRDR